MSPKKSLEENMEDADRDIRSKNVLTGATLVPLGQFALIAISLASFYFAFDKRLTALESAAFRDRWTGTMQERWQSDFQSANDYKVKTVDVRNIQEKLKNN